MPFGTAVALVGGPPAIAAAGWHGWWWLLAAISTVTAVWLWVALPRDLVSTPSADRGGWMLRLRLTLSAGGPWLVALAFAVYSAQWLAVIGFLPSMYSQAGLAPALVGVATGFAAAVNMVGNIASGRLLHHGARPERLLYAGFAAMAIGGFLAFAPVTGALDPVHAAAMRYGAVLLFSSAGGLIPGTLFSLAVRLAPDEGTISTTVGWMQQWSSAGQLAGPPLVAWVATRAGGWQWSWVVTCGCALSGLGLAFLLRRVEARALTSGS
jgi:MFS family permease